MCNYYETGINYYPCPRCGIYVRDGNSCNCDNYRPLYQLPLKNYKCPSCKGEFSDPAGFYGDYKCPFCGKKLEGLNNKKEKKWNIK